jgi:hypothetical protein
MKMKIEHSLARSIEKTYEQELKHRVAVSKLIQKNLDGEISNDELHRLWDIEIEKSVSQLKVELLGEER